MISDQDTNDNVEVNTSMFSVGEEVKVIDGPFSTFRGTISHVDDQKNKLKVEVLIFSRATMVELDFIQVERVS
jgi:transcriptional antiterminator NusG